MATDEVYPPVGMASWSYLTTINDEGGGERVRLSVVMETKRLTMIVMVALTVGSDMKAAKRRQ